MSDTTLLILSDSHGSHDAVAEAIRRARPDGILFAGDGLRDLTRLSLPPVPLWTVRGNCDHMLYPLIINGEAAEAPEELVFSVDGIRILLCHGHRYGVKSGLGLAIAAAVRADADLLVFGHTHAPLERRLTPDSPEDFDLPRQKPLTLFNPGSIGDWRHPIFGTVTLRRGTVICGHGTL